MYGYADPTIVHSAECLTCGAWVRDSETMDDGDCPSCVDEREQEDEQ